MTVLAPDALTTFLAENSLQHYHVTPLPMDASKRCYYRLEGAKMLLMCCPISEKPREFVKVSALLNEIGLSAPKVVAQKEDLFLIEDFGDLTYRKALTTIEPLILYSHATDVLIHIKNTLKSQPEGIPSYDLETMVRESLLFIEWYSDLMVHKNTYEAIWTELLQQLRVPSTLILRDYHIDNLFYLESYPSPKVCGVIDFQDAVWGPVGYDLISLTRDARTTVPATVGDFVTEKYITSFDIDLHEPIYQACKILNMQRQLRIMGVFSRLSKRDKKHHYLDYLPRVTGYILEGLEDPLFKQLKQWLNSHHVF